jgi:hypothetical protein
MANGSDDFRQKTAPRTERDSPMRPDDGARSVPWPETGNMTAHNQAANKMFKTNSTKLQRNQAAQQKVHSQELPKPGDTVREQKPSLKRLEKGDYAGLRLETAQGHGKGQQLEKPQIEEGKLSFARDRKKPTIENAPQKRELKDGELSCSRSRSAHDLSRGR